MNQQLSSYYTKVSGKRKRFCKPVTIKMNTTVSDNSDSVIDLCSDNEDVESEKKTNIPLKTNHELLYSINQIKNNKNDYKTTVYKTTTSPRTPKKSPQNPSCSQLQSPTSKKMFYSPAKNRRILSPQKAKKNLGNMLLNNQPLFVDQSVTENFKSYDDKTLFLLETIYKYLKNDNLRSLLPENVDNLFSKCMEVVKPGMRLVCRLYWRKRGWYRKDDVRKITKDDNSHIGDPHLELMLNSLLEHGLIDSSLNNDDINFDHLVQVLKADELKKICKDFKLIVQNKEDAIRSLKSYSLKKSNNITNYMIGAKSCNEIRVLRTLKMGAGACYKLSELADIAVTKLLYLMNLGMNYGIIREKKLELMFINSKANIETYPIDESFGLDNATVVFNNRHEFESYYDAYLLFEKCEMADSTNEKLEIITKVFDMYMNITKEDMNRYKSLPLWLQRFTPAYVYIKILDSGVQELKKPKKDQYSALALNVLSTLISQASFRQHKKAEWYAEKALILIKHMNCYDEAAKVLLEGLASDLPEEMKLVMRQRGNKMATVKCKELGDQLRDELLWYAGQSVIKEMDFKANHINHKPRENFKNSGKIKFETFTAEGERVVMEAEEFCIQHYINSGVYTNGEHWEGKIVTTIFFLLFWDIIYMKLPCIRGIFLSRYQKYPLDLFTESFYVNRKTLVDEKLNFIQNSPMEEILREMKETWTSRPECEQSGITRSICWDNIAAVCTCLGEDAIAAICRRLALNYQYTHSGFPDLTLWNNHTKKITFVEVKTDSDKPSIKQLQWMQYLRGCGVPVEFCYVGINTTRCKARAGIT